MYTHTRARATSVVDFPLCISLSLPLSLFPSLHSHPLSLLPFFSHLLPLPFPLPLSTSAERGRAQAVISESEAHADAKAETHLVCVCACACVRVCVSS